MTEDGRADTSNVCISDAPWDEQQKVWATGRGWTGNLGGWPGTRGARSARPPSKQPSPEWRNWAPSLRMTSRRPPLRPTCHGFSRPACRLTRCALCLPICAGPLPSISCKKGLLWATFLFVVANLFFIWRRENRSCLICTTVQYMGDGRG